MDAMEAKMLEWRKKVPSKRQLTSTFGKIVQQKSVAVLYTPSEQDRIKKMTDLIAKATSDYERGEHWDRIMAVVDALTNTSNRAVLKESIRYLRLRLGDASPRVVILALTLTEAVVKNCGHLVHLEISAEPFMNELEALHKSHSNKRGRDSLEIAARILDMVQAWGEAFLPYRHDYPLFIDTYHNMRKKGVKFPEQYDEKKVPVLTPPTVSSSSSSRASMDTSSVSSTSSALAGLSPSELYHVATNVTDMFEDMLHEAQKTNSSISNRGVILELAIQARELVQRMEGLIQSAVADGSEKLADYLTVNDNLHAALKKYDQLSFRITASNQEDNEDHYSERRSATHRSSLSSSSHSNNQTQNDDDNDPFAEFVRARAGSSHSVSKSSQAAAPQKQKELSSNQTDDQEDEDEDDPFASFVQQRAAKILGGDKVSEEKKPAAPAVEKNLIDLWDDEPVSSKPQVPAAAPLADLWLGDDLLATPAPAPVAVAVAAPMQPSAFAAAAASVPSQSLTDDLWGDAFAAPIPVSARASATPLQQPVSANNANPFDLLDFSQKTTISVPSNPFDFSPAPARSIFQQPAPAQPKPFNPFDF